MHCYHCTYLQADLPASALKGITESSFRQSKGFTLIELVAVIVLLGVLSVTALPRLINLSGDADEAVQGAVVAAFQSGVIQANLKWLAQGGSSNVIAAGGTNIEINANGYPIGSSNNTAGCIELWNDILSDAPPLEVWNFTSSPPQQHWVTIVGSQTLCLYINLNGEAFSTDRLFVYYSPASTATIPAYEPGRIIPWPF